MSQLKQSGQKSHLKMSSTKIQMNRWRACDKRGEKRETERKIQKEEKSERAGG